MPVVASVLMAIRSLVRSRAALHLEMLALRHQLLVLERTRRPSARLTAADHVLWVWLSRIWTEWRGGLVLGHRRLAPPRLPAGVDLEEPTRNGAAECAGGHPCLDPYDGRRQ